MLQPYESVPTSILACPILEKGKLTKVKDSIWNYHCKGKGGITTSMDFDAGKKTPEAGDYIIQQSKADIYHCPKEVFEKKYKPTGFTLR
jgi:hypothetical protein